MPCRLVAGQGWKKLNKAVYKFSYGRLICSSNKLHKSIYKVYTIVMKTKIQKWGNSLGVRLPKSIAEQKSLREGLGVSVILKNNQIVLEPENEAPSLDALLAEISPDNLHNESEWSDARGNEIW